MKKQQGYTLVELMVVIAIIGILAALAIPSYTDYSIRAQIAEGVNLSNGVTSAVDQFVTEHGTLPTTNAAAGLEPAGNIQGQYVSQVEVVAGVVTVTYGKDAHAIISASSLRLVPDTSNGGSVIWTCTSLGASIANKHLPATCR